MQFAGVSKIIAEGVLGEFDYVIEYGDPAESRLRLIYAPNGRGKTNVLRGVCYALTPSLDSLQLLVEIPIKRIHVEFITGASIQISRESVFAGAFTASAFDGELEAHLGVDPADFAGRLYRRAWDERQEYQEYLRLAQSISGGAVFIGDDRLSVPVDEREVGRGDSAGASRRRNAGSVSRLLERVERMLTRQAMDGMSSPRRGVGVYADLTRSTLRGDKQNLDAAGSRAYLEREIKSILTRGKEHEKYGLLQLGQIRDIRQQLTQARANDRNLPVLRRLLKPFLDSMDQQIDSLASSQKLIDTYVRAVNSFLDRKEMRFAALEGISLHGRDGTRLQPDSLSSGERHLLLLLSHAVLATADCPLVILDEPEISLGLEWQRALLDQLLACSSTAPVQFLVASHSVQVMSGTGEIVQPSESGQPVVD